jgi:putative CocE/NonD family hydrolase
VSSAKRSDVAVDDGLELRLSDGVVLRATVWRPRGAGRFPVLLIRTPYNRQHGQDHVFAHPAWYASHGFAVVSQDMRGRWGSDGVFEPFLDEARDGLETVAWAASLPFSNGDVGMTGMSYPALAQLHAAAQNPEPLRAFAPIMAPANPYEDWVFTNGAFALAFNVGWSTFLGSETARRAGDGAAALALLNANAEYTTSLNHLPLRDLAGRERWAPFYQEWLRHPRYDAYWRARDAGGLLADVRAPTFTIGGWYDVFLEGSIRAYESFSRGPARDHARLVLTPWWHAPHGRYIGALDFGEHASADWLDRRLLEFFVQHLQGGDAADTSPVRAFVTGADRWDELDGWPPGATTITYYARSEQRANSLHGDGGLSLEPPGDEHPDRFTYEPSMPTPSLGGRSGGAPPMAPVGPVDQRPVELSNGVLVYTSERLEHELFVAGELRLVLYATTSAKETDWTVKVCDVHPSDASINLQETIWRTSYEPGGRVGALPPNEIGELTIPVGNLCHLFREGHRIRLEISSSSFPHWDRNLNTGNPLGVDSLVDRVVATQTVFHERLYATRLLLPVPT